MAAPLFPLPPLPYDDHALEPHLSAALLREHHDGQFARYTEQLNALISANPQLGQWSLEQMTRDWARLPDNIRVAVRNNAGGVYTHALYFNSLAQPKSAGIPKNILTAIDRDFGSLPDFWRSFRLLAHKQFGSGNLWLVADRNLRLHLTLLNWQDTPFPLMPLGVIDLWEHAWYPQYASDREKYLNTLPALLNWTNISARYQALMDSHIPADLK